MFRKLICYLLIVTIGFSQKAFAGKYYDDAVKAVSTEFLNLESTVQHMILYDVQDLVSRIMQSSSMHRNYISLIPEIDKKLLELMSGFLNVASLSSKEIKDLQEHIETEIKHYSDYNRQLYEITWIPPTAARLQYNFKSQFEQLVRSFRVMCETGRSKFGYIGPALAIPPEPMSFMVMITASTGGNTEIEYEQNNYANKDLSTVATGASFVAGLGASNAFATMIANQFATQSMKHVLFSEVMGMGSANASSLASVSIAAGVVLVVALVAIYATGLRKYNKRMKDYIAGEVYKIHNSPTSQDINAMYKDRCKDLLVILDETMPLISKAINGSQKEKNEARAIVKERAKSTSEFQNDMTELLNTFSRRSLLESYQNSLCIKQPKEYRTRDENLCQIVDSTLYAPKNSYQIENPDTQEINGLKEKEDELFHSIASGNLSHIIYQTIQNHVFISEDKLKGLNTNIFRNALATRQNALLRLNKLLSLSSKLQDEAIKKELVAFKKFMETRKKLLDAVAAAIECTFKRIDKSIVLSMIEQLNTDMNTLMERYSHIAEVQSLQYSFNQLKSYTQSL